VIETRRRRLAIVPLSLALVLILAAQATGLTWTGDRALTSSGGAYAYGGGLAVSSAKVAHATYEQKVSGSFAVFYRRSATSGTIWGTPVRLSRGNVGAAGAPSIDASGAAVDAVWVEGDKIFTGLDSVVMYRRSTNGGKSWRAPLQLSPTLGRAGLPRVLHGPAGRVVVTWTDQVSARIHLRVSTDRGASFGPTVTLGRTTNHPLRDTSLSEAYPTLAAGKGVLYAAFHTSGRTLRVRRSTDGGRHWSAAVTLATNASGRAASAAAAGSTVVVAYTAISGSDSWAVLRRSTNKGTRWSSPIALGARSSAPSDSPVVTYRAGAFHAAFERCATAACARSAVYYRKSVKGAKWSRPVVASVRKRSHDYPADVDVTNRLLILYDDVNGSSGDVYVRQGR
jgi:hypothetical protein